MCGIYWFLHTKTNINSDTIEKKFYKGRGRGPDDSKFIKNGNSLIGFHRLAINDLTTSGEQPFHINDCTLVCNGEIYNHKELVEQYDLNVKSSSDCEVIIHLYKKFGISKTLNLLDGVFAFVLYDSEEDILIVSRDLFGVRPLYYNFNYDQLEISSELKMMSSDLTKCIHFPPGKCMIFTNITNSDGINIIRTSCYNYLDFNKKPITKNINSHIYNSLNNAVAKRVDNTERPIGCLLSGGLDSSIIASLVKQNLSSDKKLNTFSIGLENSVDIIHSRIMAKYLNSEHHEVIVTEKEMLDSIPDVIKAIESYDTTSVRASVGNYLIGKYITENTDCKVIFNGDGADEVAGGYLYFRKCPSDDEYNKECKRLLKDIHCFDVLRSDRSVSTDHGLEARTPWLDKTFVETYLRIDLEQRVSANKEDKFLIRESFKHILPPEIYNRKKEAFSDGVSSKKKSWFSIIADYVSDIEIANTYTHNNPTTPEQSYYRELFRKYYKGADHIVPYFWMPKYIEATDSSARTLNIYS